MGFRPLDLGGGGDCIVAFYAAPDGNWCPLYTTMAPCSLFQHVVALPLLPLHWGCPFLASLPPKCSLTHFFCIAHWDPGCRKYHLVALRRMVLLYGCFSLTRRLPPHECWQALTPSSLYNALLIILSLPVLPLGTKGGMYVTPHSTMQKSSAQTILSSPGIFGFKEAVNIV